MKKYLLPVALLFVGASLQAQQDFFALTGKDNNAIAFKDFRTLDLRNGTSGTAIFSDVSSPKVFSDTKRGFVTEDRNTVNNSQTVSMAALAYNNADNTLVYMPMFSSNVYILNPETKETVLLENPSVNITSCDINSHITRMTTGYDGNVYAMNNSGTQLIQITKNNGKYVINNLGIIKDDASNGANSFTQMQTGFGGDMISDAQNNLYVFAAFGNVFKIDSKNMTATFIGKIAGLTENYSVNGAAVNQNGNVVVGSAKGLPLYEVNMETFQATSLNNGINLPIYDLASKYFLNERISATNVSAGVEIYPTKVTEQHFNVRTNNKDIKGNMRVEVFSMEGKKVQDKKIMPNRGYYEGQIELDKALQGMYIVNITDDSGKPLLSKKILVEQ